MPCGARLWIATAAVALSAQSASAQSNVSYICPSLDTSTEKLSVRVDSGCKTGMARYKDNDLQLVVDQQRAVISVTGTINYHPIISPIVTQDCSGARQITLAASGVEARRYTVVFNNVSLGVMDMLTDPQPESCIYTVRRGLNSDVEHVNRQSFDDWSNDPIDGWRDWRAPDVFALLSPLLADHPESSEGRPQVNLQLDKRVWNMRWPIGGKAWKSEPFVAAWVTRHGFLDDSVSGDRYFIELRKDGAEWRIEELFGQYMCARGENAGQWTGEPCP